MKLNQIYNQNSINMKEVEDNSIDLILTSPPYEQKRTYSDDPEDIGNYNGEEFVDKLKPIMKECLRILKPTGNLFLNFSAQIVDGESSLTEHYIPIAMKGLGYYYIQPHYWWKSNTQPDNYKGRLKNVLEIIWHFAKDKEKYIVYKDAIRVPSIWDGHDKRAFKYNPLGADPGNIVWDMEDLINTFKSQDDNLLVTRKTQDQKEVHPAKMYEKVAQRFILYGSKEKDIVLDPFCGSGTTLRMAKDLGRSYIGYDIKKDYCKLSERILAQENLF